MECSAPRPGRYVVMGDGVAQNEPVARILQETWNPDGTINGIRNLAGGLGLLAADNNASFVAQLQVMF